LVGFEAASSFGSTNSSCERALIECSCSGMLRGWDGIAPFPLVIACSSAESPAQGLGIRLSPVDTPASLANTG